jgi:hypothetical protein
MSHFCRYCLPFLLAVTLSGCSGEATVDETAESTEDGLTIRDLSTVPTMDLIIGSAPGPLTRETAFRYTASIDHQVQVLGRANGKVKISLHDASGAILNSFVSGPAQFWSSVYIPKPGTYYIVLTGIAAYGRSLRVE